MSQANPFCEFSFHVPNPTLFLQSIFLSSLGLPELGPMVGSGSLNMSPFVGLQAMGTRPIPVALAGSWEPTSHAGLPCPP